MVTFPHWPPFGMAYRPPTLAEQREAALAASTRKPVYQDCGCCGAYHLAAFNGDCRNDLFRVAEPDELHGSSGWLETESESC